MVATAEGFPQTRPDAPRTRSFGAARQWMLELSVGVIAMLTALATYLVLSGSAPVEATPETVGILLAANVILALFLIAAIVWRLMSLSRARGTGVAGAQLHVRMVMLFGALAIIPTVMLAIFSAIMLNLGVESWFSQRVKTAIDSASSIAEAYVSEHKQSIRSDVLTLAGEIDARLARVLEERGNTFNQYLQIRAKDLKLAALVILDGNGKVVAGARAMYMVEFPTADLANITRAQQSGDVVVVADTYDDSVQAIVALPGLLDKVLLAMRYVDPTVLQNQRQTLEATNEYERLESNRTSVQLTFAAVYSVVGLLMLLGAVSLGLNAANRIVTPIGRLIGASERVSAGDLTARVETAGVEGELASLSNAFNRMTSELQSQQDELVETGRVAEDRRAFAEAVLSGVSAGVIGLDALGRIDASNPVAAGFLALDQGSLTGRLFEDIAPEIAGLLAEARTNADGKASGQLDLARAGKTRNLSVKVSSERSDGKRTGFVVTLDDMTDLVSAQRSAAWGDVARRIAHEIKNPLTPIQLSAERLRRKYGKEIVTDPDIFEQCTQTIIRQVGDIGRMVDEFSSFARMPVPIMREEDLSELTRQSMFLQSVGNAAIAYEIDGAEHELPLRCDGRLVAQALTNVLKNAAEAVTTKFDPHDGEQGMSAQPHGGQIHITIERLPSALAVRVADNGVGLPGAGRDRLTEPYVTTRGKGTGLGLAIVKKIMEDHGGTLTLSDSAELGGALVSLTFPLHLDSAEHHDRAHEQVS